jgi:pimeloyl-ACP methyl ester carboxylesterase
MLEKQIISESDYRYIELGEGNPVVILHGLMGGLSNFEGVINYFPSKGYKILVPELPVYKLPLVNSTVKSLAEFLDGFLNFKKLKNVILLGNSLGGHIALLYAKFHPEMIKGLIITGSSGLYENAMGDGYPKRGDYDYIKAKSEEVFYDPKVATKEIWPSPKAP